ncbi:MOSC domain-containing protein [Erythrobacter arachoides]|uniref:MOSC domain-containing protein n=2 Tax=Aurantiacibacter arachoides TaxID=1850444 RepID=A0A844ZZV5_9SPHN|nr:MOSC domain-containing protein [Aurantiacibacter arachoides]
MLPTGQLSAIAKRAVEGPVIIGHAGVVGDTQVDRRHHGYPAMAVHLYPAENYEWLQQQFGPLAPLAAPGGMGENLHSFGIDEDAVCIGDRFRLGTAVIEASQPRQPCATIERHLSTRGVIKAIVASGRCGMFFRVLEDGVSEAGDRLELLERGSTDWSVRRAFRHVYGDGRTDKAAIAALVALPRVSDRLVRDASKRLR